MFSINPITDSSHELEEISRTVRIIFNAFFLINSSNIFKQISLEKQKVDMFKIIKWKNQNYQSSLNSEDLVKFN